ncbi:MAG TPA: ABC-2 family transporter protein, partial [Symbiobacteriaceae bacterium]|nr:ABC-2 family transporter protein [Symbiobacteriaceae bacterium]
ALRILLTWVLPFAFVGFYPAAYFLRPQAYWLWAAATPLMGIALFGAAVLIWRAGLKRYHGAGS